MSKLDYFKGGVFGLAVLGAIFLVMNHSPKVIDSNGQLVMDTDQAPIEASFNNLDVTAEVAIDKPPNKQEIEQINGLSKAMKKSLKRLVRKVKLDDAGQLIVNGKIQTALRNFFDASQQSLSSLQRQNIASYLYLNVNSDAAEALINLIDLYFPYKIAEKIFLVDNQDKDKLETLQALTLIRTDMLGQKNSRGLFFERTAKTIHHLKKVNITQNNSLSNEERQQALQILEESAVENGIIKPLPINEKMENLKLEIKRLRLAGESEETIHQARIAELGEREALDIRDQEIYMQKWKNRYIVYLKEKKLIDDSGLDKNEKALQREELMSKHYQEHELAIVKAYDQQSGRF